MNKRVYKFREAEKLAGIRKNIKFTSQIISCLRKTAFSELKQLQTSPPLSQKQESENAEEEEKNQAKIRCMVLNCTGTISKKPEKFNLRQVRELLLKSLKATVHSPYTVVGLNQRNFTGRQTSRRLKASFSQPSLSSSHNVLVHARARPRRNPYSLLRGNCRS